MQFTYKQFIFIDFFSACISLKMSGKKFLKVRTKKMLFIIFVVRERSAYMQDMRMCEEDLLGIFNLIIWKFEFW